MKKFTKSVMKNVMRNMGKTNSQNHHSGIKVMLEDNVVGKVQEVK